MRLLQLRKIKKSPMLLALRLAKKARLSGEIPVGCVIVDNKMQTISFATNLVEKNQDPTAHAEILAIRKACKKLNRTKLDKATLYVTLEPCKMCEFAIIQAGIKRVYFGAYSDSLKTQDHKLKNFFSKSKKYEYLGGIKEIECQELLISFFQNIRK